MAREISSRKYRRYFISILLFSIFVIFLCSSIIPYDGREKVIPIAELSSQQLGGEQNLQGWQKDSVNVEQSSKIKPKIEVFVLPSSKGSLAIIEPLCYHRGSWVLIEDSEINIKSTWSKGAANKKASLETFLRESKLPNISFFSKAWLDEESHKNLISWFERTTALQIFDRSCTNIAHFAGRLMLYFHFLANINIYHPKNSFQSIFVRESEMVQNLLTKSYQNHRQWQKQLIETVLYGRKFRAGLFDYPSKCTISTTLEHVNHNDWNFYVEDSSDFLKAANTSVCFKKAVLLGLLKGKFFLSPVLETTATNTIREGNIPIPKVPTDAIIFRRNWYKYLNLKPPRQLEERLIYIKREGKRRSFSYSSEVVLNKFLEDISKRYKYSYISITPDQLLAQDNLQMFSSASIVISLHGAHLTNCIFMAPCAVLIEIFPPRFTHDMYRDGGNSGLQYFSWQLRNVTPFPETHCMSPQMCKRLDEQRKVFYRDRTNLSITHEDLQAIGNIIEKSVSYITCVNKEFRVACLPNSL